MDYLDAGMIMNSVQALAVIIGGLVALLSLLLHAINIEEYSNSLIGVTMAALAITAMGSMTMIPRPSVILLISELYLLVFLLPVVLTGALTLYKSSEISFSKLCVMSFYGWLAATFVVVEVISFYPAIRSDLVIVAVANSLTVGLLGGAFSMGWFSLQSKLSFEPKLDLNAWVTKAVQFWF